ncbi:phage baseplate protein [Xenorhabdus nematophila]|uniref:phage baseplate protein n=1 Tax=Xenorhabdus nematophila TaxID=628 RepID=UPI0032B81615
MDLLSGFNAMSASVITRSIGEFQFDCVVIENHSSNLRITENPIESGAAIADHAVLEPKEITIAGIMVGYQPPQHFRRLIGGDISVMDKYPIPIEIKAMLRQSESLVNRYLSTGGSLLEPVGYNRPVAPWLPDYQGRANDSSQTLDRVGKAYNDLLNLQKKGEPMSVLTGFKQYNNMMIVSVSVTQMNDNSAEFNLTLREIFIVETQTAKGLHPNIKKSAPKKKSMGKTQPKQVGGNGSGFKFLDDNLLGGALGKLMGGK